MSDEQSDPKPSTMAAWLRDNLLLILIGLYVGMLFVWTAVSNLEIAELYKFWIMIGLG